MHNKGNDCIIEFCSDSWTNGKDGYKETRQVTLLMVKGKKTLDDIKMLSEKENLYHAASSKILNIGAFL